MTQPVADGRDPWLAIELRHLAALSAIEREGTFSEAALSLGYVQSAVSGQLTMLERLTGTRLVERSRGPGPHKLTEAGQLLLAHARDILAELETARERLVAGDDPATHPLRVGVARGLVDRVVSALLAAALAEPGGHGMVRVDTIEPERLAEALTGSEIDVALTILPLHHEDIATAKVREQRLALVVQGDSPLARRRRPPTLEELSRLPLVLLREGWEPSRVEVEMGERGLSPNVIARADGWDTVLTLVTMGLGAAVLPRGAVGDDPRVGIVDLKESLPSRVTGVAWLRARSGDARLRRFVDLACQLRDQP